MINSKENIMGRIGITYLDVANAIATIQGRQKNPTVDAIREELGTGSRSTIAKYFLEWKTKNGAKNRTETGIPTELQHLIQSLWEKIQSDADKKIEAHQAEANEEISDVKNQLLQIQLQNTLLHAEINSITEKLNVQLAATEALNAKLHQAENEKAKCDERIRSLETQNQNHKTENERSHQLLKNTQDNLTHYQHAIEKQRAELQMQIEKERSEYDAKLSFLEKQLIKITEDKSIIDTKYHLLFDECQILKNNLDACNKENTLLQLKNNEIHTEKNHLQSQNEKIQHEASSNARQLKESVKACHELTIELAVLKSEHAALNKKSESDENKIHIMQSELTNILQENATLKRALKEETV